MRGRTATNCCVATKCGDGPIGDIACSLDNPLDSLFTFQESTFLSEEHNAVLPIYFPAIGTRSNVLNNTLIYTVKSSTSTSDSKPRPAPGIRPPGTMTGLRGARRTGTGFRRVTPSRPRPRKRVAGAERWRWVA